MDVLKEIQESAETVESLKHRGQSDKGLCSPFESDDQQHAEAPALIYGLEYFTNFGIQKVEIKCDSILLAEWILHKAESPWSLWDIINYIHLQLDHLDTWYIQYCFRKGNKVADTLANCGAWRIKEIYESSQVIAEFL
ncbi:hypothetical protein HAX54_007381 [Datura stramonium]|uniref:RNase H type-1 domain-containing protein n=1 Tax=Datura stramonium TaxID=4076 RepID=A0ABS8RUV7_DATST|nr:hypothetical protein [Datura stramonium]